MKVLIYYQRGWAKVFGIPICQGIKAAFPEATFSALVMKESALRHFNAQKEVTFQHFWYWDPYLHQPDTIVKDQKIEISEICDYLGLDSVWPAISSLRAFVRNYREKYYYAYTQAVDDEQLLLIAKSTYLLIKDIEEKFSPDIVFMPNAVGIQHLFMMAFCKKRGIFIRNISDPRIHPRYFFLSENHVDAGGPVHELFNKLRESNATPSTQSENFYNLRVKELESKVSDKKSQLIKYSFFNKNALKRIIANFIYQLRFNKTPISTHAADTSSVRLAIRDHLQNFLNVIRTNRIEYSDLPKKYVFFPLQFQPEQTIDVYSPFFNNQIESARLAAMTLPDDVTLVVKDHPAMVGRRSISYLRKLSLQPNIKLVDYRWPSAYLIKNSIGLISFGGTAVMEAAFLEKPVAQLGDCAVGLNIPSVYKVKEIEGISPLIKKWAREGLNNEDKISMKKSLLWWIDACLSKGFEMDYIGIWEGRSKETPKNLVENLVSDIKNHF